MTSSPAGATPLEQVLFEVKRTIVGQDVLLERMAIGLLSGGHLLVEGVPGLAKTLAVKSLAGAIGGQFQRIQFTPYLVPADLTGTRVYRQHSGEFDRIHRVGVGLDVDQQRRGAHHLDRGHRGDRGVGHRDHAHPGPDAKGTQRQCQCVRAVAAADCRCGTEPYCEFRFEGFQFLAENVPA